MTANERWHADMDLLSAYVAGRLSRVRAASVEAHLLACPSCRSEMTPIVAPRRLEQNFAAIVNRVGTPRRRLLERLLAKVGLPEHTVRALAVTPSDRGPWLAGIAAAILVAIGADAASTTDTLMFALLVVAPLLPLAGVTAGVTLASDPLGEIIAVTPTNRFRLLALRSFTVLVPAVLLSAGASITSPSRGWEPVLWLLPSLGLSATALALGTWISIRPVAATIGCVWVTTALIAAHGAPNADVVNSYIAFRPTGQCALLVVGLLAGVVAMQRREALDLVDLRSTS